MTRTPRLAILDGANQLGSANTMPDDVIKKLTDAVVTAQATALASSLLTNDLYVQWILRKKNPAKSLRLAFDRISVRLEAGDDALKRGYEKRAVSQARTLIQDIFRKIEITIDHREGRGKGAPPQT